MNMMKRKFIKNIYTYKHADEQYMNILNLTTIWAHRKKISYTFSLPDS